MTFLAQKLNATIGELDAIDIVQCLAQDKDWEFERISAHQIAIMIEGAWRNYTLTLAWSQGDETLRLLATFDLDTHSERIGQLYALLNLVNDRSWSGAFSYWPQQGLMAFRYALLLSDAANANSAQIENLLSNTLEQCERYYPAFQLTCWGDEAPEDAIKTAIGRPYGTA